MDWLVQNWVWVLVFAAFIGMHLFGHGGHGGQGSHGDRSGREDQRHAGGEQGGEESGKDRPQGHHH